MQQTEVSDLISRSATIQALKKREPFLVGNKCASVASFKTFLKNRPSVDAVEVVRCKDCRHCLTRDGKRVCALIGSYFGEQNPDEYCSRGERA